MSIRVGVIGVGNCAKSLIEGVALYGHSVMGRTEGLAFPLIGGYSAKDIEFVLAYDVDARKVGRPLSEAIYAPPNCAMNLAGNSVRVCGDTIVQMGSIRDGVASHMLAETADDKERFFLAEERQQPMFERVVEQFMKYRVDVALIYLPVGSQQATEFYVKALLEARVSFVNCIPVFIVSDPLWQKRIHESGVVAIGDDMRSQVGASVLSQALQELFLNRGATVNFHCQTNEGGNTDFLNMLDRQRTESKKLSKENVITSQNDLRGVKAKKNSVHAGPSDYIPYLGDNKVAHFRIEAQGFGGAPITLDARLSVQDSPNSAGVVIDAIRYVKTAYDNGIRGPLYGPSAATQKTPPKQLSLSEAYEECKKLAAMPGKST